MIAAIVPAHNEEGQIPSCLAALRAAARCPRLGGEQTILVVVLDDCTDRRIAQFMNLHCRRPPPVDVREPCFHPLRRLPLQ